MVWYLAVAILLFANIVFAANEETLQCYASSALETQKDGKIICPSGTAYCVKEVVNATSRSDCGTVEGSTYFGRDVWDRKLAQCVYRKCASHCPTADEDRTRTFGGSQAGDALLGKMPTPVFNRTSYCCDTNLCNRADSERRLGIRIAWLLVVAALADILLT